MFLKDSVRNFVRKSKLFKMLIETQPDEGEGKRQFLGYLGLGTSDYGIS